MGAYRGLRVAFVGKGGAGKSLIAGTLCRQLARQGQSVLAMDIDTMVGISVSLGLGGQDGRLPTGLAKRVNGKGWQVNPGVRPSRLVDRYASRREGCSPMDTATGAPGVRAVTELANRLQRQTFPVGAIELPVVG